MPQQTSSAARTLLSRITKDLNGQKLRVAGRVLTYDVATGLIILIDDEHALLVDVSLALDSQSREWVPERLSTIIVIGDLERTDVGGITYGYVLDADLYILICLFSPAAQDPLTAPPMPTRSPALKMDRRHVLRAILVVPSPDLDLSLWNAVLKEDEEEREV
ncbi:hypothetical protein NLJ89_g11678 [Agrocybe chaxingu]|uniref:Uncharacterized protein n=1 Tax=Agrocybe chaxingu TaxID=84603 RepID=A0A9W8JWC1_9AGAR|nr:hypothetical protein NLJ89_g11678 [Agrocybe chaxingu]